MKLFTKISLPIICLLLSMTLFNSCQTSVKQNDIEKTNELIPKIPPPPAKVDTTKTLKLKTLIDYIVLAKPIKPNLKNGEPFGKLEYDKVIAYDFKGREELYPAVIDKHGMFVPVVLGQKFLTQEQADKILSTLTKKTTYGEGTAACFEPHFALVLYKDNKMTHQINICLGCNYLISDIDIPAETHKKVNKGTKDEYALIGFTEKGKKAVIELCKELDFTYGQEKKKF